MSRKKTFDCMEMKREIQARLHEEMQHLSVRERLERLNELAREASIAPRQGKTDASAATPRKGAA